MLGLVVLGSVGEVSQPTTTSRQVAEMFNKRHADVLRGVDNLECSGEFTQRNFAFSSFKDSSGKTNRETIMTKDGFTFLVMGFTGKEASVFKEKYITAFNQMESYIRLQESKRQEETIKQLQIQISNTVSQKQFAKLNGMVVELYNQSLLNGDNIAWAYEKVRDYQGESPFMLSLKVQLSEKGYLSDKQVVCLLRGSKRK
jgi:Rha family phage regulatory protein